METKSVISKQWLETGNIIQSHNLCKKSSFIFPITNDCFETTLFPIWCCRYVTVSKLHFFVRKQFKGFRCAYGVSNRLSMFPINFNVSNRHCFQCMFPNYKLPIFWTYNYCFVIILVFKKMKKKMMFHLESISESSSDCRDENEFQNENLVAVNSQ